MPNPLFNFVGVGKKLRAICNLKGCEELKGSQQSMINNLHWSVVSSPPGDGEVIVANLKSIERHMQNLHVAKDF